jgi:L,D-peptidoglycan transpeptidase YkuD (ErfK/YbiS/YcfS/YnhG family)
VATGRGVDGESLAGAFDYVIAIDYNRVDGSSPLDPRRPQGAARGGGVWLHVDHGGPTQGCISLGSDAMRRLLQTLDPADPR